MNPSLMRCPFCGLLQDEPPGVKTCLRCGGGLEFEQPLPAGIKPAYLTIQMELDQVAAPAGQNFERYILVTVRTPEKVPEEEKDSGTAKRPALNFVSVLDVSGSMQGEKINQVKAAVDQAIRFLHEEDIFSLITFSDQAACPIQPTRLDEVKAAEACKLVKKITSGGMTALCSGLEMGIDKGQAMKQESNLLLLLSDGQANVGETDLEKIGHRALLARNQGLIVSTLGVGLNYNEALMAEIATQGGGRFYHVLNANQIPAMMAGELGEAANLAARDVKLHLTLPPGTTLIPLTAAYPVQQAGDNAVVDIGDIPCNTEWEIPLRLAVLAQTAGTRLSVQGSLAFLTPAGHKLEIPVNRVTVRMMDPGAFQIRQGMVQETAERIFIQMKAASLLGISRQFASKPAEAEQYIASTIAGLQNYAERLGADRPEKEKEFFDEQLFYLRSTPASSKQAVSSAHNFLRHKKAG